MIDLRPATIADSDKLFAWRNDEMTCACSRSTAAIKREDHDRWMQFNVVNGYPAHLVLIAESEYGSVGVVRFDGDKKDVLSYEASITLNPKFRGQGLAFPILAEACSYLPKYTVLAEIRENNIPSRKIFERCGFTETGKREGFVKYKRGPIS